MLLRDGQKGARTTKQVMILGERRSTPLHSITRLGDQELHRLQFAPHILLKQQRHAACVFYIGRHEMNFKVSIREYPAFAAISEREIQQRREEAVRTIRRE